MPPSETKYSYRRRLPHMQRPDAPVFVTFPTAGLILSDAARTIVLNHILRDYEARRVYLYAAVIMPNHVHTLFVPLRGKDGWPIPLVDILQCLKGTTAHRINRLLGTSGPVWQEESLDHVLRSDESLKEKCQYIAQNPVRAGLVRKQEDYRWLWLNSDI